MTLTDEQISALDEHVAEFRAADHEVRDQIAQEFVRKFRGASRNAEFDIMGMTTVRVSFAKLRPSLRGFCQLVRQHLCGKIKATTRTSAPTPRIRVAEERCALNLFIDCRH